MNPSLLCELHTLRTEAITLVAALPITDQRKCHHPQLSPLLWHIGHLLYTEQLWIGERLSGTQPDSISAQLFRADGLTKSERSVHMPPLEKLTKKSRQWATQCTEYLIHAYAQDPLSPLLQDDYLLHFLIQHHSQHLETMYQILLWYQLQKPHKNYQAQTQWGSEPTPPPEITHTTAVTIVGAPKNDYVYDNECPQHVVVLAPFAISKNPITNAQYLSFMETGGYDTPRYWSIEGWHWRLQRQAQAPLSWRRDPDRQWFGIGPYGPHDLYAQAPVCGINAFEAAAFARFASARLPSEQEWEAAARNQLLEHIGEVWEWCSNTFYPYPGFQPYPYRGYSMPWFDGVHRTLRGASRYSKTRLRRPTFRNFHTPDKRYIFAGLRLARYTS